MKEVSQHHHLDELNEAEKRRAFYEPLCKEGQHDTRVSDQPSRLALKTYANMLRTNGSSFCHHKEKVELNRSPCSNFLTKLHKILNNLGLLLSLHLCTWTVFVGFE